MKPIRLGVIFDQQIRSGGGYQQALNASLLTLELPEELVNVVFYTTLPENVNTLLHHGINAKLLRQGFFQMKMANIRKRVRVGIFLKLIQNIKKYSHFEKNLIADQIDLVYFISPTNLPQTLEYLNYITTVWDLSQRDDPEFPEVRWYRQFESREQNYSATLTRATAVFVDSELGKINAAHRYGIDLERIHVLPFQAAEATRRQINVGNDINVDVKSKYKLDLPYIFYPAQFWAHKNHIYLLEGLRSLEDKYDIRLGAIFSGGDQGNQAYVERYVIKLGLESRVRFVGFQPNEEIVSLYRQSIAMVMPSYFGPTNLPPLEAFKLGVPVLYSNKAGLRDQVGDAALLMDLKNPESMALHLKNLIEDKHLREQLITKGYARLKYFDSYDRVSVLRKVIEDFRWRRLCWE